MPRGVYERDKNKYPKWQGAEPRSGRRKRGRAASNPAVQAQTLQFLEKFIGEHGYSPSFMEIGAALFMARSTVSTVLVMLRAQGRVTFLDDQPRTVRIVVRDDIA